MVHLKIIGLGLIGFAIALLLISCVTMKEVYLGDGDTVMVTSDGNLKTTMTENGIYIRAEYTPEQIWELTEESIE